MDSANEEKFKIRVAGCFLEYGGRFLILHRRSEKSQGGKWGLPAGKVDKGETDKDAVIREVAEETAFPGYPARRCNRCRSATGRQERATMSFCRNRWRRRSSVPAPD